MRENIGLYRGKRKDNDEWIEGFYVRLHDSKGHESHRIYSGYAETDCGDYYPDWHEVIPETVGECSGLPDKNGKRIFEGDILQGDDYPFCHCGVHNYFAEVTWFENSPAFGLYTFKNPVSVVAGISTGNCDYMEDFESANWKVIGNIHDNPELLEVSGDE